MRNKVVGGRSEICARPERGFPGIAPNYKSILIVFIAAFLCFAPLSNRAAALTSSSKPLNIYIFVGPRNDFCFSDHIQAIEKLVRNERIRINKAGGIGGRKITIQIRNDRAESRRGIGSAREALADPEAIAWIGLQNSERAREIFHELGPEIIKSGIPWLSGIFVTSMFADYPNVFTTRGSQEEESLPVIAEFIRERGVTRPAYIGLKGQAGSEALLKGLREKEGFPTFIHERMLQLPGNDSKSRQNAKLSAADISSAIEELKSKNPDIIFLSVGGWRVPPFLSELERAGLTAPLFVTGRLEDIFSAAKASYPGDVFQIGRDELPDLYNNRIRSRLFRERPREWVFHGERNQDAFDRVENHCEESPANRSSDMLSRSNLRAIGLGLEYRDMIAMIAEILNSRKRPADIDNVPALRQAIVEGIPAFYSSGRGIFKGSLEDWSFRPSSRTTVRTPFIITRPETLNGQQLASMQYVPLKDGRLRKIPTLYLAIDLIRIFRIDDSEKSFGADFYLSMSDENNPNIDMIEFSNAFLDQKTNSRHVSIQTLHDGGPSDLYPSSMKVYAVSGKFMLDPNYKNYPFDVQRFTVELRPKRGDAPFIVQPLKRELRGKAFDSEGWDTLDDYVSYDQDFIPIVDTKTLEPRIIPFYKGSFVWVLKRNATDFYLRVVVPLIFIMIVAYLAIFISSANFESIVTIQVTALLSAVALYITTPKVDSDTSTLSDRIFLFNYMIFSLMIGISILRVNRFVANGLHLKRALAILHVVFIPIFVALMAVYVYGVAGTESQADLRPGPALADGFSRLGAWLR
jgi:hypothetical protein